MFGCTYIVSIRIRYALFWALAILFALQSIPNAVHPYTQDTEILHPSWDVLTSAASVNSSWLHNPPTTDVKTATPEFVNSIINPILGSNRNIFLKKGIYVFVDTLEVNDNTTIYAEQGTQMHFIGNSYLALKGNNITVFGIEIVGDGLKGEFGIRAEGDFITVSNCTVQNIGKVGLFGFGITYEYESKYGLIIDNIVRNTGLDGIHVRGNEETHVINNIVKDSNDDAIASIFGKNNVILNNTIDRYGAINLSGNGIYVADNGTTVQGNFIENTPLNGITADDFEGYQACNIKLLNNTINNAGSVDCEIHYGGILLNFVYNSTVYGNIINGSLYDGIRIFNGSRNQVYQNTITNSHRAQHSWSAGIVLEYQSTHNHVIDNVVGTGTFTFREAGYGVDYNIIHFNEPIMGEIKIEGSSTVFL